MADEKRAERPALVLHMAAGGEPLLFALLPEDQDELEKELHTLLVEGTIRTIRTKDGATVTVNFAHVAVAYVDDLQRKSKVFGLH